MYIQTDAALFQRLIRCPLSIGSAIHRAAGLNGVVCPVPSVCSVSLGCEGLEEVFMR